MGTTDRHQLRISGVLRLCALLLLALVIVPQEAAAKDAPDVRVELTEAERQWLEEHPVIKMGPDPNWPPFEFFDEDS